MFADCRLYCRYIFAISTIVFVALIYTSRTIVEKHTTVTHFDVKQPLTCSSIQDIAHSRVRNACEQITESYNQVTQDSSHLTFPIIYISYYIWIKAS